MATDFIMPAQFALDVPNFGDYFGIWSIEANEFSKIVGRYQGINLHAHISSDTPRERIANQNQNDYAVTKEGIALFNISGPMMKSVSSMSDGTSTVRMRQQIRSARKNPDVKAGFLQMDTPGGTVRGNQDLADEVAAFAAVKPIYVFVEDMTASAGVSIASQATKRFANNASALYGAMGTYAVLQDMSGMAEKLGVKVHVIKAGEYKGMGTPGTEISDAQIEEAQRIVNSLNDNYLGLIARGLNKSLDTIRALADGRVHPASVVQGMGLIDGIQTADETYSQLVAATKNSRPVSPPKGKTMENENAATLAELKAAFPKSTAEWRESQIEGSATMQKAAVAYAAHVEAKADAERVEHAKQLEEAKAAAKPAASIGHEAVRLFKGKNSIARNAAGDASEESAAEYLESGDAIEDFNAAVAKIAGPASGPATPPARDSHDRQSRSGTVSGVSLGHEQRQAADAIDPGEAGKDRRLIATRPLTQPHIHK
jgi:signal peptide peptidase SppA